MQTLDDSGVGSTHTTPTAAVALSDRDRAILRAVGRGGAEVVVGALPDLFLDGRCCCDQLAARRLVHAGLIAPAVGAAVGQRVAARLTRAGSGFAAPVAARAVVRR
ncbi:hypothetical protein, partial [Pseudonocardia lacus]|uniref:hypothetical protein n=1 Tax=Pseudonocardia lacus TaxID=2835865 RepID=UPI0020284575